MTAGTSVYVLIFNKNIGELNGGVLLTFSDCVFHRTHMTPESRAEPTNDAFRIVLYTIVHIWSFT